MQLLQVEAGTCLQKMIGTVRTGVILKDVSVEVHGGELSAVLGSKGKEMNARGGPNEFYTKNAMTYSAK